MFGGWGVNDILNDLWRYDCYESKLELVHKPFSSARFLTYHTSTIIGTNAYIFGGIGITKAPENLLAVVCSNSMLLSMCSSICFLRISKL